MIFRKLLVLLVVFFLAAGIMAETPLFHGGLGLGQAMRVPYSEWGPIGLVLNGRIGGFLAAYPFAVGRHTLGIEAGIWAFVLPLPDNLILMGEAQLLLTTWLPLGSGMALEPQIGYSAVFGFGEQASVLHGLGGGARLNWRRLFGQVQLFVVLDALIDGQGWSSLLPMAAFGLQW